MKECRGLSGGRGVLSGRRCGTLRPYTFMNMSGASVRWALNAYPGLKGADVLIVHDDTNFDLGQIRLHRGPRRTSLFYFLLSIFPARPRPLAHARTPPARNARRRPQRTAAAHNALPPHTTRRRRRNART